MASAATRVVATGCQLSMLSGERADQQVAENPAAAGGREGQHRDAEQIGLLAHARGCAADGEYEEAQVVEHDKQNFHAAIPCEDYGTCPGQGCLRAFPRYPFLSQDLYANNLAEASAGRLSSFRLLLGLQTQVGKLRPCAGNFPPGAS